MGERIYRLLKSGVEDREWYRLEKSPSLEVMYLFFFLIDMIFGTWSIGIKGNTNAVSAECNHCLNSILGSKIRWALSITSDCYCCVILFRKKTHTHHHHHFVWLVDLMLMVYQKKLMLPSNLKDLRTWSPLPSLFSSSFSRVQLLPRKENWKEWALAFNNLMSQLMALLLLLQYWHPTESPSFCPCPQKGSMPMAESFMLRIKFHSIFFGNKMNTCLPPSLCHRLPVLPHGVEGKQQRSRLNPTPQRNNGYSFIAGVILQCTPVFRVFHKKGNQFTLVGPAIFMSNTLSALWVTFMITTRRFWLSCLKRRTLCLFSWTKHNRTTIMKDTANQVWLYFTYVFFIINAIVILVSHNNLPNSTLATLSLLDLEQSLWWQRRESQLGGLCRCKHTICWVHRFPLPSRRQECVY